MIINPYCQQAIIRSAAESEMLGRQVEPYIRFLDHSLESHKEKRLYKDFLDTYETVKKLYAEQKRLKVKIRCKLYNCTPPHFAIIYDEFALSENLMLGQSDTVNYKLSGKNPLLMYKKGKVHDAIENNFNFVWNNLSIPLEDYSPEIDEKYFLTNQFFILLNLQNQCWEKQWGNQLPYNKHNNLYMKFTKPRIQNNFPKSILDLGCGSGGGGSFELLKDATTNKSNIEMVDVSKNAISWFITKCEQEFSYQSDYKKYFFNSDMLTYLSSKPDDNYDLIYANLSIIYSPRIKAQKIFQEIYRVLKKDGLFCASFFTEDYFLLKQGDSQEEEGRPFLQFMRVPMHENLQIITSGERKGEIRRFYTGEKELFEEITGDSTGSQVGFEKENCTIEFLGKKNHVMILVAKK